MKETNAQVPYRRRVTEEWFDSPPSERAAAGDQDHDLDGDDLDGPPQLLGDREAALGDEERENAALGDDDDDLEGAED